MAKIRKQTFSLDQYLKLIKSEKIRSDQDCQRLSGQWNANMVNELIYTVLTDNYIPPIILGEETVNGIIRQWIIDGLQRSSSLSLFRYANTKITKSLDEYMVTYQRKVMDESGNVKRDGNGEIIWEVEEFDIRNKTYEQLPEELKERFDGYQIELAIHQECDPTEISKLVRKYNNHTAMNNSQRAFTYIDAFAREIREITENRFFLDVYKCSRNDKKNGTFERVVGDMVILCNYPDKYRKETKQGFKWFKEGSLKMAEKTGCPIIPMAIVNTADIFEKHVPFVRKTHVVLTYGEPVYVKNLDKEQRKHLGSYTQGIIRNMLENELKMQEQISQQAG